MNSAEKNKEGNSAYGRVIKYLSIFGGAQGVSTLLNLVRNKVASALLGTEGLGLIALYSRTIQMLSDYTNLSLALSAVRRISEAYENEDAESLRYCVKIVRSIALLSGLVGMLLLLLLSPFISDWIFGESEYYTSRFILLSPVILFMAVSGGEIAVLRGVRELNKVALYTVWAALGALVVVVPLYCFMGLGGIFPGIFAVALLQMLVLLAYSIRIFPYSASPFSTKLLSDGKEVVKMGSGYIYASILTSTAIWLICKGISAFGNGSETGLFSSGYLIVGMLPAVLFAALDSDYYPRLSGAFARKEVRDRLVNEHVEVHVLVQSPIILAATVALPLLLPLLYTDEFLPALHMTQIAMMGLLFHTNTYPMAFMALSNGDTRVYILQETLYNVLLVLFTVGGYAYYGLTGAGVGMCVARLLDLCIVSVVARCFYDFRLSGRAVADLFVNILLFAVVAFFSFAFAGTLVAWAAGGACVLLSGVYSLCMLSRHGNIFSLIVKRFLRRN